VPSGFFRGLQVFFLVVATVAAIWALYMMATGDDKETLLSLLFIMAVCGIGAAMMSALVWVARRLHR
jgi:hypothetical protein